jgi:hypothetical protein
MLATPTQTTLPPPDEIALQIAALEQELYALRRLLRLSKAAAKVEQARQHRLALHQAQAGESTRA